MAEKPALSLVQAQEVIDTKTAPRVTKPGIEARIASVEYIVSGGTMTICLIKMKNAFIVVGTSAAASLANFDAEVGRTIAYDNAFRQLWPLEGYLLREQLAAEAAV